MTDRVSVTACMLEQPAELSKTLHLGMSTSCLYVKQPCMNTLQLLRIQKNFASVIVPTHVLVDVQQPALLHLVPLPLHAHDRHETLHCMHVCLIHLEAICCAKTVLLLSER